MGVRDNLRAASFRGVPFEVDTGETEVGRQNAEHAFAQRDTGYVEDMGRLQNRPYSFDGYVAGPDWMAAADALRAALEVGGPGKLVHPVLGVLTVNAGKCAVSWSTTGGGLAVFKLSFVESGSLSTPAVSADTGNVVVSAVTSTNAAVGASFVSSFDLSAQPAYADASALQVVNGTLAAIHSAVSRGGAAVLADPVAFAAQFKTFQTSLSVLITTPAALATQLQNLFLALSDVSVLAALAAQFAGATSSNSDPMLAANENALNRLTAQAALAAAAFASAQTTFVTFDDAAASERSISAAADAEAVAGDWAEYQSLLDLMAAVSADIFARSVDLPRIVQVVCIQSTSTLELSQSLYGDPERAAEIAERNGVLHPGFCYGSLSVLSS